ncbi:MAG: TlyA family RNA methyltransferase [Clostridia bacterium]|nr:TlyA family RNA methyltransferase [Clostridia bacterium]
MPVRADEQLVKTGLADTIELARALIMEGRVLNGTNKILKASDPVKKDAILSIKGETDAYVSRGAKKLKRAVEAFQLDLKGKTCMDVGASTGGFTDVMLREGAKRVFSIDVGYNLLDYKLRSDSRVTVMERTNARFLEKEMFDAPVEFGATDVSFISLKAVLPSIFSVLEKNALFVALIKPQFEAQKEDVGEKGVVRRRDVHESVVKMITDFVQAQGWTIEGLDFSPIRGPEGNIEFLLLIRNTEFSARSFEDATINDVIDQAYDKFIK